MPKSSLDNGIYQSSWKDVICPNMKIFGSLGKRHPRLSSPEPVGSLTQKLQDDICRRLSGFLIWARSVESLLSLQIRVAFTSPWCYQRPAPMANSKQRGIIQWICRWRDIGPSATLFLRDRYEHHREEWTRLTSEYRSGGWMKWSCLADGCCLHFPLFFLPSGFFPWDSYQFVLI